MDTQETRQWTYKQLPTRDYMIYEDGFAVANVFPKMKSGTCFDDDARLIAAAPKFLEALKLLADWPIDPYRKIPQMKFLGDPQYPGYKSAGVALAAARRFARAALEVVEGE